MMHQDVQACERGSEIDGASGNPADRLTGVLEGVERNLNELVQALSLLGVKQCSRCRKFFRTADPGAVFASGSELVCFECIREWWPARREQLSCPDRQKIETNLVFWLRSFHDARSLNASGKLPKNQSVKFELLAKCLECRGTGIYMGDKCCRYCAGPGTVRVAVPEMGR